MARALDHEQIEIRLLVALLDQQSYHDQESRALRRSRLAKGVEIARTVPGVFHFVSFGGATIAAILGSAMRQAVARIQPKERSSRAAWARTSSARRAGNWKLARLMVLSPGSSGVCGDLSHRKRSGRPAEANQSGAVSTVPHPISKWNIDTATRRTIPTIAATVCGHPSALGPIHAITIGATHFRFAISQRQPGLEVVLRSVDVRLTTNRSIGFVRPHLTSSA